MGKRNAHPIANLALKIHEFNEEYFGLSDQRLRRAAAKPAAHSSPKTTLENKSESVLSVPEEYPTIVTEQEDAQGPELSYHKPVSFLKSSVHSYHSIPDEYTPNASIIEQPVSDNLK